jgi:cytochrome c oxidase subunit 2
MAGLPLFPEQASTMAGRVDALYFFLIGLSAFFGLLIATLVIVFAVRYRRRSPDERPKAILGSVALELTWSLIPLGIVMFIFLWSADIFFSMVRVPPGAMEVYVVGKRWMWKAQHMTGQREINELHVPVGVPVKVTLASEDVIHSFYIPAFRVKRDAIPGRYQTMWFEATKPGRYHLFCAEYCGTKHSEMIGSIIAMEPAAFQAWLQGGSGEVSMAAAGERKFQELGCVTCHRGDTGGRGPNLNGLAGQPVRLAGGGTVTADEGYIRESIVNPSAKIVAGYQPIMPAYQGLVTEEGLMHLVAYVQSLGGNAAALGGSAAPPGGGAAAGAAPGATAPGASPAPQEPRP